MTEPEKTDAQVNTDKIEEAVTWVIAKCENDVCAFCGWKPAYTEKRAPDSLLRGHLRNTHPYQTIEAHLRQSIDPVLSTDTVEDVIRRELEVTDEFTTADPLYVSPDVKARAEKDGYRLKWAALRNVQKYKDLGFEMVLDKQENFRPGDSTEDGRIQSGDVVLMRCPPRLVQVLQQRQAKKRGAPLATKKEDFERKMEAHARAMYDGAIRAGATADAARNLAKAAERGLAFGSVDIKRG